MRSLMMMREKARKKLRKRKQMLSEVQKERKNCALTVIN
jgi:hypothetical protein